MADEITREEKTSIAKEFLKYSPPGEFNNVHEDISVILNEKLNNIPGILETSLDYHQDQLTSVFANSEKQDKFLKFQASKLNKNAAARMQEFGQNSEYSEFLNQSSNCQGDTLISAQAHVEGNTFYDPKNSNIFDFDPISQVISNVRPAPANVKGPASAEPLRTALNTETNNYVKHHYPKGVGSVLIRNENDQSENAEEFKEFIILIEDHEFQPQNRWNGKWRSECMVTVARDGNIYLQGGAKVHVHYYEDSNVQLVTRQSYDQILRVFWRFFEKILKTIFLLFLKSSQKNFFPIRRHKLFLIRHPNSPRSPQNNKKTRIPLSILPPRQLCHYG